MRYSFVQNIMHGHLDGSLFIQQLRPSKTIITILVTGSSRLGKDIENRTQKLGHVLGKNFRGLRPGCKHMCEPLKDRLLILISSALLNLEMEQLFANDSIYVENNPMFSKLQYVSILNGFIDFYVLV